MKIFDVLAFSETSTSGWLVQPKAFKTDRMFLKQGSFQK
jgi:hypothetical protein